MIYQRGLMDSQIVNNIICKDIRDQAWDHSWVHSFTSSFICPFVHLLIISYFLSPGVACELGIGFDGEHTPVPTFEDLMVWEGQRLTTAKTVVSILGPEESPGSSGGPTVKRGSPEDMMPMLSLGTQFQLTQASVARSWHMYQDICRGASPGGPETGDVQGKPQTQSACFMCLGLLRGKVEK